MADAVVLVAEDDVALLDLMQQALERHLYVRLAVARDSLQALRQVKTLQPDLVVLDLDLPGLDEAHLVRQLKSLPATQNIPVVAVAAPDKLGVDLLVSECRDSLAIPFSPPEFAHLVRKHLPREKAYERAYYTDWQRPSTG